MEDSEKIRFIRAGKGPRSMQLEEVPEGIEGRYVKVAFLVKTPNEEDALEHLWIRVLAVEGTSLHCQMYSHPTHDCGVRHGEAVHADIKDVEEIIPPFEPN